MGYAKRKPRPVTGNCQSSILKPTKTKSHSVLWVVVVLPLFVAVGVALFLCPSPEGVAQVGRKMAEKGDVEAKHNSGSLHMNGKGIGKDKSKADDSSGTKVQRYRKAAENGDVEAMVKLSEFYRGKDAHEEIGWLHAIGMCYYLGKGVEKDMVEAVAWFRRAAEHRKAAESEYLKESAPAMLMLGMCYRDGEGVEKDAGEAVKWFWKAAEKGVATAMLELGNFYCIGVGVERDFHEAVKWWRKAEAFGSPEEKERARKLLREVRPLL